MLGGRGSAVSGPVLPQRYPPEARAADDLRKLWDSQTEGNRHVPQGPTSSGSLPVCSQEESLWQGDQRQAPARAAAGVLIFQINGLWLRQRTLLGSWFLFEAPKRGSLQKKGRLAK